MDLLKSGAAGGRLIIGFTEMGTWGATDDATEQCFKAGTLALLEAIEEHGCYPVKAASRT